MGLIKPSTGNKHRMMNITGRVPLVLHRSVGGQIIDYVYVESAKVEVDIEANVQPFKPYEIYQMPEALRTREWVKLYSGDEIRGFEDGDDAKKGDEFEWQDKWYVVDKVINYKMGILDHYKAIAYKIRTTAK